MHLTNSTHSCARLPQRHRFPAHQQGQHHPQCAAWPSQSFVLQRPAAAANHSQPQRQQPEQQQQPPQQQQQQQGHSSWVAPAAWVSSVLAQLTQSVDVDSVQPYTQLLQECVVLQPGLLSTDPQQAAATCWQLERHTRSSAVWFGPAMVSDMLLQHTPASLAQHLSSLLDCWVSLGHSPHSFGALWLQAPSALLHIKNVTQFESHLAQLARLVPEIPPSELLASSASLAGLLLSLHDVSGQLEGHIHREVPGVLVISHPSLQCVRLVQQQQPQQQQQQQEQQRQQQQQGQQQQQQQGPVLIQVFGVLQQQAELPVESSSSRSSSQQVAPWQQQPERKHTGGVYEQLVPPTASTSSRRSGVGAGSSSSGGEQQQQLLAEIEVWPSSRQGSLPLPVAVLPPR